jgi:thiol-disulfide isomerase/thioredoxin
MRAASFLALLTAVILVAGSLAQPPAKGDPKKADPKAKADSKAKAEPDPKYNLKLKTSDIILGASILGPKVTADDLKGKAVLVDYWGINCPPCLAAMPRTAELYAELADFGLVIIGAHRQGGQAEVVRAVALNHKANFPIMNDCTVRGSEDNNGLPHCLLFDHAGACVFRGRPTEVDGLIRKAVGAALVAGAGREKWSPGLESIVKDLNAGKPPASVLPRVAGMRNSAGQVGEDAKALLASMTAGGQKKLDQAKEKKEGEPLEAFLLIEKVPTAFKGTPLATEASELVNKLKADKAVKAELSARPALEGVKKLDQQLGLGADDPRKAEWQKAHKEPLKQLKTKVEQMKKAWPDAKSTQEAVAIAERYGVELK